MSEVAPASYAFVGDVHGHLQLALCTLARWQQERGQPFAAVFLCGDVGTFTEDSQLDSATRKHARDNPCELEFLRQWSAIPQPPWLDAIFQHEPHGLGLTCPVIMVHGNHEGFTHLETLYPRRRRPTEPVPLSSLPPVDTAGHILFLPPGWTARTDEGHTIAGVGGIEPGQRRAKYHAMAYLDEDAIQHLLLQDPVDVLLTHQGPAAVQGDHGSRTLDLLLELGISRYWFHGHSTPVRTPTTIGPTTVVPLGDLAFSNGKPGMASLAILEVKGTEFTLTTEPPAFLYGVRLKQFRETKEGLLVHPELWPFVDGSGPADERR